MYSRFTLVSALVIVMAGLCLPGCEQSTTLVFRVTLAPDVQYTPVSGDDLQLTLMLPTVTAVYSQSYSLDPSAADHLQVQPVGGQPDYGCPLGADASALAVEPFGLTLSQRAAGTLQADVKVTRQGNQVFCGRAQSQLTDGRVSCVKVELDACPGVCPVQKPVTVTVMGDGTGNIVDVATDGTTGMMTIQAKPDPGSSFVGWGGLNCDSMNLNCRASQIRVCGDQPVTATFKKLCYPTCMSDGSWCPQVEPAIPVTSNLRAVWSSDQAPAQRPGLSVTWGRSCTGTGRAGRWTIYPPLPSGTAYRAGTAPTDKMSHVWVVGSGGNIKYRDALSVWHSYSATALPPIDLHAIWIQSDGLDAWAVGDQGTVLRMQTPGQWQPFPGAPSQTLLAVIKVQFGGTMQEVLTTGDGGIVSKLDLGTKLWSSPTVNPPNPTSYTLQGIAAAPQQSQLFIVGAYGMSMPVLLGGPVDGSMAITTAMVPSPMKPLHSVWFGMNTFWAAGDNGTLLQRQSGGAFEGIPTSCDGMNSVPAALNGLGGDTTRGWVVGDNGTLLRLAPKP